MAKAGHKKVVMAFGAFDGVHTGHMHYLKQAKKLGNYLIVVIARDKAEWKFPRSFNLNEQERKKLIEMIGIADNVILGSTRDALERILELRPDIAAITPYHIIDRNGLEAELKEKGVKTKVRTISVYKREFYNVIYGVNIIKRKKAKKGKLMGLPTI